MNNSTYHHGDVKNALISAGVDIITEQGIENLSIRYAAKKIGVSHTAPYRHFKNKEEFFVAVAVKGFDVLDQCIEKAVSKMSGSDPSVLAEAGRAYIKFAVSNSNYYRIMFGDYIKNKTAFPDFFTAYDQSFRKLIHIIENCGNKHKTDKTDLEITAVAVWSLLHGYCSLVLDNEKDKDVGSKGQIDLILQKLNSFLT
ncbi:MAG: TetR/AcrR family transcriptional regulator [Desulfobacterales bacterium]|nr:TetR/AcrR family transcriptional regulator [Desulfobacterales bacterium]